MRKNSEKKKKLSPQPTDLQSDLMLVLFERPLSSADLVAAVGELRSREVPLATFYRQLQRAVDLGWVGAEEAEEIAGPGRPGRLYRLTPPGVSVLQAEVEHFRRRLAHARASGLIGERSP